MSKCKDKIKHGDLARIAELTGYSKNYVMRVLSLGDRRNKIIEETAKKMVEQRESLVTKRRK